jgi:BTB/POZ domain
MSDLHSITSLEETETRDVHVLESAGIIRLNVGGVLYDTSLSTLLHIPDTYFTARFSPASTRTHTHSDSQSVRARAAKSRSFYDNHLDESKTHFIDRDGVRFRHVLNYMRGGGVHLGDRPEPYKELLEEADFFMIVSLANFCRNKAAALTALKRTYQHQHQHQQMHGHLHGQVSFRAAAMMSPGSEIALGLSDHEAETLATPIAMQLRQQTSAAAQAAIQAVAQRLPTAGDDATLQPMRLEGAFALDADF